MRDTSKYYLLLSITSSYRVSILLIMGRGSHLNTWCEWMDHCDKAMKIARRDSVELPSRIKMGFNKFDMHQAKTENSHVWG